MDDVAVSDDTVCVAEEAELLAPAELLEDRSADCWKQSEITNAETSRLFTLLSPAQPNVRGTAFFQPAKYSARLR